MACLLSATTAEKSDARKRSDKNVVALNNEAETGSEEQKMKNTFGEFHMKAISLWLHFFPFVLATIRLRNYF